MHQVLSYLRFLIKSRNQHGVHSPFVYDLVTNCFYDKTKHLDYDDIESYKKKLMASSQEIEITDLGAGSKFGSNNLRQVKTIAKNSGSSLAQANFIFRLIKFFNAENILELGTSLGIATKAISLAAPKANIVTVEGCQNLSSYSQSKLNSENISFRIGSFDSHLNNLKQQKWDVVFFDGDHSKDGTIRYFEALLPTAHNNSVFIFDDIHWSKEMEAAWEHITAHKNVTVSIDTFYKGLVFFRKEQQKEHFVIRL